MSRRTAKQLTYGVFYLAFWAVVISAVYFLFLRPEPSCFDGKHNQNEEGIDCGGPCAQSCLPAGLEPLEVVGRILTFRPSPDRLSILAQVSNPNFDQAAKSFTYDFLLYGAGDEVVQSFRGTSFAYAREAKYILLPNASLPARPFSRVGLELGDFEWVPGDEMGRRPSISLSGIATEIEENSLRVEGRVLNADTVSFPKVTILAIFWGELGNIAGASETEINNLRPNESSAFTVIHPSIPNVDTSKTKVFVYAQRP
ncbi:MAG: hypothetical protein ACE5HI_12855 [bacterium]